MLIRASVHVDEILPGTRSRGLSTSLSLFIYKAPPIIPATGVRLKTSAWRRVPDNSIPPRAKVNGAYVNSALARQDALDSGYDDCILLDNAGNVSELSAVNIFLVRDGTLITPNASSGILEGINRRSVLVLAQDLDIPTEERTVSPTELYVADEVLACGTSAFLAPVSEIDARTIPQDGPITKQLRKAYRKALTTESDRGWLTKLG